MSRFSFSNLPFGKKDEDDDRLTRGKEEEDFGAATPYEDDYEDDLSDTRSRFVDYGDEDDAADDAPRYTDRYSRYDDAADDDDGRYDDHYTDDRYDSRYDDRYTDDRYDSRYDDRYADDRYGSRYDDRYADDRYGSRYDDRYDRRYDDRYSDDSGRFGSLEDEDDGEDGRYAMDEDDRSARVEETKAPAKEKRSASEVWADMEDYADNHLWVTFAAMVILPPLGLYLLYRRRPFEEKINYGLMAATAVWFIVAVVLILNGLFGHVDDRVQGTPTIAPTQDPALVEVTPEPETEPTPDAEVLIPDEPEATEEVVSEPTPVPEDVFVSAQGMYYHNNSSCSLIGKSEVLAQITMDNAINRGKYACPECYGLEEYYATENGTYYHKDSKCSGMTHAKVYSLEAAVATGKPACPKCVGTAQTEVTAVATADPNATPEPMPAPQIINANTKDQSKIDVYCTESGTWFHTDKNCQGMKNAKKVSLLHALLSGKTACPQCAAVAATAVYCTEGGKSYHKNATCNGMQGASRVSLAEALVLGKKECKDCQPISGKTDEQVAQEAAESVYYVYNSPSENGYYHINSTCSGMQNAEKVTLASMLKAGVPACPTCCAGAGMTVFLSEANKTYHSASSCSGLTDLTQTTLAEALANGYTKCPKCWDESANNNG